MYVCIYIYIYIHMYKKTPDLARDLSGAAGSQREPQV